MQLINKENPEYFCSGFKIKILVFYSTITITEQESPLALAVGVDQSVTFLIYIFNLLHISSTIYS